MICYNNYRLRRIEERDLEKVLKWRNSERIRSNMYNDHIITIDEHIAWYKRVEQESNNSYMIFELCEHPVGVVNFTNLDKVNRKCLWGFYLGEENVPCGTGMIMGHLGLTYAFSNLKVRKVCGEVFAFNLSSINFHKRLGFVEEGRLVKHVLKNGRYEDIILFALFEEDWEKMVNKKFKDIIIM